MKHLIIFSLLFASLFEINSQTVIIDDDLNNYPTPNVSYICDFGNHYNIDQMDSLWGSWLGSVSYLDEFIVYDQNVIASFDDGHGFVMNSCGASWTEGSFLNVPFGGIKKTTCYKISFDISYFTSVPINSTTDDLVFRVALGSGYTDTSLEDLNYYCCNDYPDEEDICILDDIKLGELEAVSPSGEQFGIANNFYTIDLHIYVAEDFPQLLFYPLDTEPTAQGGTPVFGVMFDNLKITQYCNEDDLVILNQDPIPVNDYQANSITVTSSPDISYTDDFATTTFEAEENIDLLHSSHYEVLSSNYFFEAIIDQCSNPPECDNALHGSCAPPWLDVTNPEISVRSTVRPEQIESNEFIVFPNPTKDYLDIFADAIPFYKVELFDKMGKLLVSKKVSDRVGRIDVVNLPPGLYILHIIDENSKSLHITKVIKQ